MLALITRFVAGYVGTEAIKRFLFSKLGLGLAGGVAVFLAYQVGNFHGFENAAEQCRNGNAAVALKTAQRDLEIAKTAEADAATKRDQLQQLATNLQEKVKTYENAIAKLPANKRCVLSDTDVRRLRVIGN